MSLLVTHACILDPVQSSRAQLTRSSLPQLRRPYCARPAGLIEQGTKMVVHVCRYSVKASECAEPNPEAS